MDRSAVITFSDQLREARENALRDSEAFDGIVHVVERLGSFLYGRMGDLGRYKGAINDVAINSALAQEVPLQYPIFHTPFATLYKLLTQARNDALHQGAFARRLTGHAIMVSLVLEDALRRSLNSMIGDYMVRNPVCAELWQPLSFIRQQMLANSYSLLPVKQEDNWYLVSDLEIASYLGSEPEERKRRLAHSLAAANIPLRRVQLCGVEQPIDEAMRMMTGSQIPLLVCIDDNSQQNIIGIVTPFDLL